jgi:para-aminobenzoate synthetase component 1
MSPDGDLDLNVVIRSLFYSSTTNYLSYHTGGAITWDSDPEAEWDEVRLKAAAMERLFH